MMLMTQTTFHDFSVRPAGSLGDLLDCDVAKAAVLRTIRHPGVPPKLFLTGPPGSGKSSLIKAGLRLIACQSAINNAPCNHCRGCVAYRSTEGRKKIGLDAEFAYWDLERPIDYLVLNCRNATATQIHDEIMELRYRKHSLRIIHLEEAGSLYRDRRDELLTELMDDPSFETCRWFATAVTDDGLDDQFRRRWNVKVTTSPPSIEILADELALLCKCHGIQIDHPVTWTLLAKSSWCIVGQAMSLLAMALMNEPPSLTRKMVIDYPFPRTNPWERDFFQR